ncbi:MAG TPA: GGDEF domain-containing response regulator [Acidimicrobiales bacterium]|nr:GGDEF domain-containing response regulator [Acidimicrobiales bacterium]
MAFDSPVVLVVDDNESARRLVRMGLELEGVTVIEADNLARARQYLHRRMSGVVLDRELPDGDGLTLLADIGATCPDVPVIVNSTLDDGREPAWVVKVDKGDLPEIVRALDLSVTAMAADHLAVVDLVRSEAESVVAQWEELCRWDPLLPPDSAPGCVSDGGSLAKSVVDAVGEALQRPQPLGWGADPALASVMEMFASSAGAIDVAIGQLVCLREAFRRHLSGHVPPAEEAESRARVDMIIDRAIWSAARVAAARLQRQVSFDPLTGLGNRKSFDGDLDRELDRAHRYGRELTMVLVAALALEGDDLDEAAEARLRRMAGVLSRNLRRQDGVHRIGPSTFAVLLPETAASGGRTVAERLRTGLGPDVTLGEASFPDDGDDAVTLLHAAEPPGRGVRSTP